MILLGMFLLGMIAAAIWYDVIRPAKQDGLLGCVFGLHDWEQEFGGPRLYCKRCGQTDHLG